MLSRIGQLAQMERDAVERSIPMEQSDKKRPRQIQTDAVRKSLVRLGLSLVIQKPELAARVHDVDELAELDLAGMPLLIEITHLAAEHPDLNSASILERYRGSEHHRHLEKLAAWDHMIPDGAMEQEFDAVFRQLRERWADQQATSLMHQTSLSADEKSKLRALLSQRAKSPN